MSTVILPMGILRNSAGWLDIGSDQLQSIRSAISGHHAALSRIQAIDLLRDSNVPDRHLDFQRLIENENEPPSIRRLAAMSLTRIEPPVAQEILVKNTHTRNEIVLAAVMKALGRIGDSNAIPAILRIKETASGLVASQAQFAAALISHRLGLEGNDLAITRDAGRLVIPENGVRSVRIGPADENEAKVCRRSLATQPFGITYSQLALHQITCDKNVWMVVFNRELTGQGIVERLKQRKAFVGIVAVKSQDSGTYSTAFLLLSSPGSGAKEIDLLVPRSTGELLFTGSVRSDRGAAQFSLGALSAPGAFPVKIEGTYDGVNLRFEIALSALSIQKRREPIKAHAPRD